MDDNIKIEFRKTFNDVIKQTSFFTNVNTEWEKKMIFLFRLQLTLNRLLDNRVINIFEKKKIENNFLDMNIDVILNDPKIKENELIKKETLRLLVNQFPEKFGLKRGMKIIKF